NINGLLRELGSMVGEGLVTTRPVRVYRHADRADAPPAEPASAPGEGGRERPAEGPSRTEGSVAMQIEGDAQRVTVDVGSSDTWGGGHLAIAIVQRCRELGIAGATVTRGAMGFGKRSVIHRAHLLGMSQDLPERVEVVDRPERIARLLPALDEMVAGGLVV